jgi:cytoskeletal protein RodZ
MAVGDRGTTHLDAGESFTNHDKSFRVTVTSLDPTAGAAVSVAFGDSITPIAATSVPSTSTEQPTAVTELPAPTVESYTPIEVPVETNSTTTTTAAVPATTRVTVRLRHTKIATGKHPVAVVRVTGAAHPTGRVTVTVGGKKVRTVTLRRSDDGVRAITLPKRIKAGTFKIRVTFGGNAAAAPASSAIKHLIVIK